MAELHPDLREAERALFGPIGEAQSFADIYANYPSSDPLLHLAAGILSRLVDQWDVYHGQLLNHGCPALDQRRFTLDTVPPATPAKVLSEVTA